MSQWLHFAFIVALISILFPGSVMAGTFGDVSESHSHRAAIEYLVYIGTLKGYSDGTFKPENTINRAELMKVLVASQGLEPDVSTYNNCFPDVTTDWYAPYVCYAYEQGWVSGYSDGTFKPANTVNKVEAAKMIVNAWGYSDWLPESSDIESGDLFDDTFRSAWYAPYVVVIKQWNLDGTSGNFSPSDGMDRGRVAEYLFRIIVMENLQYTYYEEGDDLTFLSYYGLDSLLYDEEETTDEDTYEYEEDTSEAEEVSLNLTSSSSDQQLEIENLGDSTVNLEGYTLETSSTFYTFDSYELAPGESIEIDYYFPGETVYLRDSDGAIIETDYNF